MKHLMLTGLLAFLPAQLLAHEAGGVVHMHPHGGEAALILALIVAVAVIWRLRRS